MVLTIILTIVHVLVCLFLMVVVLLQSGKAADLAGAFGGMGSQTVFGPRGAATALSRATTISAVLFMVTSLSLSVIATREGKQAGAGAGAKSVLETTKDPSAGKAGQPASTPGGQPKVELYNEEGQKVGEQPLNIPPPPGQPQQQQQQQK